MKQYCFNVGFIIIFSLIVSVSNQCVIGQGYDTSFQSVKSMSLFIESDEDLEKYGFPGDGTSDSPYLIEQYDITSQGLYGIYIKNITKNVIIQNCSIEMQTFGKSWAIYLTNITSTIYIKNCKITSGTVAGIYLAYVNFSKIENNEIMHQPNSNIGIWVKDTNALITQNTITEHFWGLRIHNSDFKIEIMNNTIEKNYQFGIESYNTTNMLIRYNSFINNNQAIYLADTVNNTMIDHNDFIDNFPNQGEIEDLSQACDNGYNNTWFDPTLKEGNYWSDWKAKKSKIGYPIAGWAGSYDMYPLVNFINYTQKAKGFEILTFLSYMCLVSVLVKKRNGLRK